MVAQSLDPMREGARWTFSWPAVWPLPFLRAEAPLGIGLWGKELHFPALLAGVHGQGKGVGGLRAPSSAVSSTSPSG